MRPGIAVFVAVVQTVLLAAHFFVFETWVYFWSPSASATLRDAKYLVILLAVSFVAATLLSFRFWNGLTRGFYRVSAIWLGFFNFRFWVRWERG